MISQRPAQAIRACIGLFCGLLVLSQTAPSVASDRDDYELIGPVREVVLRFFHWRQGWPIEATRILFDSEGRILERREWEEVDGKPSSTVKLKSRYEYDSHGHLVKKIDYGDDGAVFYTTTYSFDEKGNMIETVLFDSKGREETRWKYSWDGRGNKKEARVYGPDGHLFADGHLIRRMTWEYDDQNHIAKSMEYKPDGVLAGKAIYKYDEKGRRSELTSLETNGSVSRQEVFRYDRSDRRVEELAYDAEGKLSFKTTYIYEDDARGNWIKKTPGRWFYNKSGQPEQWPTEVVTRTITYYQPDDAHK